MNALNIYIFLFCLVTPTVFYFQLYIYQVVTVFPILQSEETQTKIQSLEQQISCMEDELSEARLEASKLKTELISERSAWEVKLSEIQSHVNEVHSPILNEIKSDITVHSDSRVI